MQAGMKGLPLNRIILLTALALVVRAVIDYTPPVRNVAVGDPPPVFSLTADGRSATLDEFRGSPLVIFFFANWCPCSHDSAPHILKAAAEYAKEGVQVIGVGIQDTDEELHDFTEKHSLPFPVVYDSKGEIARLYGIVTTPSSVFIDRNWKIASIMVGKIKTYDNLIDRIRPLL